MLDAIRRIYGAPSINLYIESDEEQPWSRYSLSVKKEALSMYARLGSFPEVEKAMGVSRSTVRLWHKKYNSRGTLNNVDDLYSKSVPRVANTRGRNEISAIDRQKHLVEVVFNNPMNTEALVDVLNVTAATVRRDVIALLKQKRIVDLSENPKARVVVSR